MAICRMCNKATTKIKQIIYYGIDETCVCRECQDKRTYEDIDKVIKEENNKNE